MGCRLPDIIKPRRDATGLCRRRINRTDSDVIGAFPYRDAGFRNTGGRFPDPEADTGAPCDRPGNRNRHIFLTEVNAIRVERDRKIDPIITTNNFR